MALQKILVLLRGHLVRRRRKKRGEMMEWKAHAISLNIITRLEREYVPSDSLGLLVDGSFGDVFITLSFIDSFHAVHQRNVVVVIQEQFRVFARIYNRVWLRFYFFKESSVLRRAVAQRGTLLLEPGFIYPTLPTMHPLIAEAMSSERMSELDMRTLILGLPRDAEYNFPGLSRDLEDAILGDLQNLKCDLSHAVLFSPVTNTIKNFSYDYVEFILKIISSVATVITNVSDADVKLKAIAAKYGPTFSIPPHGIVFVSDTIGRHVIITSGMMSLFSLFKSTCRFLHVLPMAHSDTVINNGYNTSAKLYSVEGVGKPTPVNVISELWHPEGSPTLDLDYFEGWYHSTSRNERRFEPL